MSERTQLLLHCTVEEAEQVRRRARDEYRGVSAYMLRLAMRVVEFDERIALDLGQYRAAMILRKDAKREVKDPRTTMLLRCSSEEAQRIRAAAKRRDVTVSEYVFRHLRRSWRVAEQMRGLEDG
jgi:hypothetical protein